MRRNVFVGNLNPLSDEDQIARFFELAGTVRRVQIARTPEGRSRGCAVIEFDSEDNAEIAIDVFDGRELLGRTLSVCAFREAPVRHLDVAGDGGARHAEGHRRRQPEERAKRGELHEKAREDWRSLRGSKRRI